MLTYPREGAHLSIVTDVSNVAVGGVLQQDEEGYPKPKAFFSRTMFNAQKKYSTYDRELLAIYETIVHFQHFVEGRNFIIYCDHKPLVFAFQKKFEKCSPRQARQLDFISQFSTDMKYIPGVNNGPADALSRIETVTQFDEKTLQAAQNEDDKLKHLFQNTKFSFVQLTVPGTDTKLWYETTCGNRLYVPEAFRRHIFDQKHNLSHPGVKNTTKLITLKYFWPNIKKIPIAGLKRVCHVRKTRFTSTPSPQ